MKPVEEQPAAAGAEGVRRVRFGIFEMDFASGELLKGGRLVRLPPQPFRLLEMLVRRPGQVVTREEIKEQLWNDGTVVDFDQGLNSCIYTIRGVLSDDAEVPRYVETLPRRGYRWVGPVEAVAGTRPSLHLVTPGEPAPARLELPEPAPEPAPAPPPPVSRRERWPAVLVLLAAGLAGYAVWRRPAPALEPQWTRASYERGLVRAARFAPGGELLELAAWGGGAARLYRSRPPAPGTEPIAAALSPVQIAGLAADGEIAYLRSQPDGPRQLVRQPRGSGPKVVAERVSVADWDGKDVFAAIRFADRPYLEFPLGQRVGGEKPLVSDLRLSPDGQHVAVIVQERTNDDGGHVSVFDRRGQETRVPGVFASLVGLAWSPAGDEVWFTASEHGADRALLGARPGGPVRVILPATSPLILLDVARDGRVLLDRGTQRQGVVVGGPGLAERDLSLYDATSASVFSADGRQLVLIESGEAGGDNYSTYVRGVDGSPAIRVGAGAGLDISPDGHSIVSLPPRQTDRLLLLPVGPGVERTIRDPKIESYEWAGFRDDDTLLFSARAKGAARHALYRQDLDAKESTLVSAGFSSIDRASALTPDRRFIFGFCDETKGIACLQPTDGGPPREVKILDDLLPVWWHASGTRIYARGYNQPPLQVYEVDLERQTRRPFLLLAPADPAGIGFLSNPIGAPSTQGYAYTYTRRLSELFVATGLR